MYATLGGKRDACSAPGLEPMDKARMLVANLEQVRTLKL